MILDELARKTFALEAIDFQEQYPDPALVFVTTLRRPPGDVKDTLGAVTFDQIKASELRQTENLSPAELERRLGPAKNSLVLVLKKRAHDSAEGICLGRDPKNDYCVPHSSVSRVHAVFKATAQGWTISDRNASNGTFVDGQRLALGETRKLPDGSLVGLGPDVSARFFTPKALYGFLRLYRVGLAE